MKKYLLGFYDRSYDFMTEDNKKKTGVTHYLVIGQQIPGDRGCGVTACVYKYDPKYLLIEGADSLKTMLNHQVYIDSHFVEGAKYGTMDCIQLVVEK